ncbi:hypothetical protein BDE27_3761 [Xenorhabdus ehlersii]|uniref:Uncharacterized protein n=1 Tax=Xenorhabdus ehlersii TaxID=290111 RepID=A0ABX9PCY0_9GAMM|nr:hypothetical protein BDE27_3761 [Xenorhabdus ehlersii]
MAQYLPKSTFRNIIYGLPRFCNTHFDVWLACLNLSGVSMSMDTRATMSSAPDEP